MTGDRYTTSACECVIKIFALVRDVVGRVKIGRCLRTQCSRETARIIYKQLVTDLSARFGFDCITIHSADLKEHPQICRMSKTESFPLHVFRSYS